MLNLRRLRPWRGPPLVLQILILLLGGLVVAQLVTLLLTIVLPPIPAPQHSLRAVAAALRGTTIEAQRPDHLERRFQSAAPDVTVPGWLVLDRSRRELAGLLHADPADIRLAFYTPPPFAGAPAPAMRPVEAGYAMLLQGGPGGGLPRGTLPRGGMPDRFPGLPGAGRGPGGPRAGSADGGTRIPSGLPSAFPPGGGPGMSFPGTGGIDRGAARGVLDRPAFGQTPARGGPTIGAPGGIGRQGGINRAPVLLPMTGRDSSWSLPAPVTAAPPPAPDPVAEIPSERETSLPVPVIVPTRTVRTAPPPVIPPAPTPPTRIPSAARPPVEDRTIPLAPVASGVFGLTPAGFVEGDFVAALRLPDGRWSVVQPAPAPFPNYWQRRLLLWFLIAFAVVAPVGWLFARRIVKPLTLFGAAAEQLGRDPSALILPLDGPAEVGRAAHAFNLMQSRLKSFVDDRTAMVGAISHDLRTPLTRMRFRIEDIDDDAVRDGMIEEVTEMEAMITSVITFIRDASTPNARERIDLGTILEDVVEDARMIGGRVTMEGMTPARVEVDPLGMRRVLANLIDNATKYGERARVRLVVAQEEAFAEIIDDGPGLPDHELERAFEPFYRSADARASIKQGSGLGLAVCRSIARAHGGDVRLMRSDAGFVAQLRVPLAFDADRTDRIAA